MRNVGKSLGLYSFFDVFEMILRLRFPKIAGFGQYGTRSGSLSATMTNQITGVMSTYHILAKTPPNIIQMIVSCMQLTAPIHSISYRHNI